MSKLRIAMLTLPFLPVITRAALWAIYSKHVTVRLSAEARDEEAHRSASLAIAGFALTIYVGLVVFDRTLELPIYYAGMSFLAYLAAYSIQGHKKTLLVDQVGDAGMDVKESRGPSAPHSGHRPGLARRS
jgi:hypothetical protein